MINADQKKCSKCAALIPKKSKFCPYCQKRQGISPSVIVLLILIVVFIVIASINRQKTGNNHSVGKDQAKSAKTAFTCTKSEFDCPFFSDIYANDTGFRKSFVDALKSARISQPSWIPDGTQSPLVPVTVADKTYLKGFICEPHNCERHQVIFLYFESQKQTIGKYVHENGDPIWFGNPTRLEREKLNNDN
ncbi:MAG: hypothetical protein C0399_06890 [Syntrophus sp. (in: bacteria)]|nr:hypothetical protein [Syntrophus sp. (in: bacteria)]